MVLCGVGPPKKPTQPVTASDGRAGFRGPPNPSRPPKEPQKYAPGHRIYPIYLCGTGRFAFRLPARPVRATQAPNRAGSSLARWLALVGERIRVPWEARTSKRQSIGTAGRPRPTADRVQLLGRRELRIRPLWRFKVKNEALWPELAVSNKDDRLGSEASPRMVS